MTEQAPQKTWRSRKLFWLGLFVLIILGVLGYRFILPLLQDKGGLPAEEANMPAIKVIVSNGCGYEQLASLYAEYIGQMNVDVVKLSDTRRPIYDTSIIVMHHDDEEDLRRLQAMTGITLYTKAIREAPEAPFTIILGRDYQKYMKKKQGGTFGR